MSLTLTAVAITPRGAPTPLFPPLTLIASPGEVTTIMGPSGIGKSTLLDAIGGHLPPAFTLSGSIHLDHRNLAGLPPEARHIGLLFQDALLFPHLSVGQNLAFGLAPGVRGGIRGKEARRARVEEALTRAGLAGFFNRDPATLSGGERTRAALMRALLAEPAALLLDEPFAKLDTETRAGIRAFVFAHARERQIPVLMVTHDPEDAAAAGGPVVRL